MKLILKINKVIKIKNLSQSKMKWKGEKEMEQKDGMDKKKDKIKLVKTKYKE